MGRRVPNGTVPPVQATSKRLDWDKHREQVRAANRARARAVRVLIAENRERFDVLYAAECAAEDPPVAPGQGGPQRLTIEERVVQYQLDEVARIYRENIEDKPVLAVQEAMRYETRGIAKERVHWARKAGLLPPTTAGVRRA